MTSPLRSAANAANAQLSTGPRTAEGRARSSRNALKHGLTSPDLIVREDEIEEFQQFQQDLRQELAPEGAVEMLSFNQLLRAAWNMQRAQRLETDLFVDGLDPLLDESAAKTLDRIHRYQSQSERSYYRHLKELRVLQTNRVVRDLAMSQAEAKACPTLVPCHELAKRTHQLHKAGAQAEEHAAIASRNRLDAEAEAHIAAARAARSMQNEPNAAAGKERNAA
jgi:hypothetical protein